MGEFGQDDGVTPLLFFEGHPGIFNDHRESGTRFVKSMSVSMSMSMSFHGYIELRQIKNCHPMIFKKKYISFCIRSICCRCLTLTLLESETILLKFLIPAA